MARHRLKMLPLNLIALLGLMVWGNSGANASNSPSSPSPSPSADIQLICHTDNPAECYPKVFQATDEFQIVKPDQDLPIGLHVRLNVQTGQKEAKINNPDEAENPALAGLPVDNSIVIVDDPSSSEQDEREQIPIYANAPKYSSAGKIKPPSPPPSSSSGDGISSDPSDASQFLTSLAILKKGLEIDGALDMLSDISHDIYYGLKITEDYETVRALFCLANTDLIFSSASPQSTISRARLASLTLASAVQNNPTALAEIEKHWSKLSNEWCPNTSAELGRAIFKLVPPSSSSSTNSWKNRLADPSLTKARISAISGLLKSDMIRRDFLAAGGMERVLEVLVESEDAEWEPAQRKVGVLALDNFLDADMGAKLGEWPRGIQASSEVCAQKDKNPIDKDESSAVSAECWDWYAKNFAARHRKDKGHWSHDLVRKLGEQRKVNNNNDKRSATLKAKKVKKGGRGKEEL